MIEGRPIVSAVGLFKKFNLTTPLNAQEFAAEEQDGVRKSCITYNGHVVEDGCVRIFAQFITPVSEGKKPAVLLLPDVEQDADDELISFFTSRGYAVLVPDYRGFGENESIYARHTLYPGSLDHGNYAYARGLYNLENLNAEDSTWFEWTYVALFSIEYLKSREDVGEIGVVGIRSGGALAWQVMLSPDIKCGVPINAAGWTSMQKVAKFGDDPSQYLGDDKRRYIAAYEAQSYAPYVKCPVLMLCSLRDKSFDCDRAYDTYSRIGYEYENGLAYSPLSGDCIGPNGLTNLQLFLEKNLKGRQIYLPDTLKINLETTADGELKIQVQSDEEGLLAEAGIFYAEADVSIKSVYRDWRHIYQIEGNQVQNGQFTHTVKPYAGATAVFAFAYARYINGFRITSKIAAKRMEKAEFAVRNKCLYAGGTAMCFTVANHSAEAVGGIFLEQEIVPRLTYGYGDIQGVYAKGGIRTYRISAPEYRPCKNDLLQFEGYSVESQILRVIVEAGDIREEEEKFTCIVPIKGGGKWKRQLLRAEDFKSDKTGFSLESFTKANALVFCCDGEEREFSITNLLWL
jgi:cephalosporin-C deacetylase-like acetyl esterase